VPESRTKTAGVFPREVLYSATHPAGIGGHKKTASLAGAVTASWALSGVRKDITQPGDNYPLKRGGRLLTPVLRRVCLRAELTQLRRGRGPSREPAF
jgi:hypothetical protein